MKMQMVKLPVLALCAAAILVVPALSRAQNNPAPPVTPPPPVAPVPPPVVAPPPSTTPPVPVPAPKPAAKKRAAAPATTPFRGTVTALDTNAMTLTVGQRTFEITSETMITKEDKPAILSDGAVGEPVRGAYKKNAEGKLDATTIRYGGAAQPAKKESTSN
jgi:hypothetical protein